jgi:hypothetical protein
MNIKAYWLLMEQVNIRDIFKFTIIVWSYVNLRLKFYVGIIATFAGTNFDLKIMELMFQIMMWQFFMFEKKKCDNKYYICLPTLQ